MKTVFPFILISLRHLSLQIIAVASSFPLSSSSSIFYDSPCFTGKGYYWFNVTIFINPSVHANPFFSAYFITSSFRPFYTSTLSVSDQFIPCTSFKICFPLLLLWTPNFIYFVLSLIPSRPRNQCIDGSWRVLPIKRVRNNVISVNFYYETSKCQSSENVYSLAFVLIPTPSF